jgi:hypothetical protein
MAVGVAGQSFAASPAPAKAKKHAETCLDASNQPVTPAVAKKEDCKDPNHWGKAEKAGEKKTK